MFVWNWNGISFEFMILNQIYKEHSKMYKKVADIFVRIKSQISELFKQNFY